MQSITLIWPVGHKILFRFIFIFVLLFIGSFSFPHTYIPDVGNFTSPYFEKLVKWTAGNILHIQHSYTSRLISDSTGMYIHILNLVVIALVITSVWTLIDRKRNNYRLLGDAFFVFIRYYLAIQLLMYGLSKIFKWQFYLPEPNTLFTTLGHIPKDLLYWSTMGISRSYTIFSGIIEVLAALLLLFRRTKLLGAIIATGAMVNVVMINFSFDISVKLYSCFLLLLCCIIIALDGKRLSRFFFSGKAIAEQKPDNYHVQRKYYLVVKSIIIIFLFADALAVYFKENNFNDDKAPRPFLHGAYEVQTFIKNNDTLPPLLTDTLRWRRMIIHRRGYLITQFMNDEMKDYQFSYDTVNTQLILDDYDATQIILNYTIQKDSTLFLTGTINMNSIQVVLKKINLKTLPLFNDNFNWTIDE